MNPRIRSIITTIVFISVALAAIFIWWFIFFLVTFLILAQLLKRWEGDLSVNEGYLMVLPVLVISVFLGIFGLFPAYFSYNFLLKKLTARFGMQVDRPKRLFVFSAFLIYGLPLLLLFWALVKP